LNFDPSLNVELAGVTGYLCMGSLTPLSDVRAGSVIKCPLCGSIYQKTKDNLGRVCDTC